jgi:hypothetical protein
VPVETAEACLQIEVETQEVHGMEVPRRFCLTGKPVDVVELLDQWFGSDYRYCKVKGDDGALYILRFDEIRSDWHLTMFVSARAQAATMHARADFPRIAV